MVASTPVRKPCKNADCDETFPADSKATYCGTPECNNDRERKRQRESRAKRAEALEERRERIAKEAGQPPISLSVPRRVPRTKGGLARWVRVGVDELENASQLPSLDVVGYIGSYGQGGPLNPELPEFDVSERLVPVEPEEPEPPADFVSYWVKRSQRPERRVKAA